MKTASILEEVQYHAERPVIKVILETGSTKEIRIAMQKGTTMKKHQAPFPIVVHVIEGSILFGLEEGATQLEKGDLIALGASIPHDLKASEDSIIRLSLSKKDTVERVKNI